MSQLTDFLKDYGSAIGPTLAFLLGIFALFIKYKIDQFTASRSLKRRLLHLQKIVLSCPPPDKFHPKKSESGLMHADEARNMTNHSRFYSKLLALHSAFNSVEKTVLEYGTADQILMFHSSKWWFDILFKDVENKRKTKGYRIHEQDFNDVRRTWKLLEASIQDEREMDYI